MTLFLIIALSLTVLALLFILIPLLRQRTVTPSLDANQSNLAIFHQHLAELNADRAAGGLNQFQYESARRDLEHALAFDLENVINNKKPKSGLWAAPVLAILVPLTTVGIYLFVGNYQAIDIPMTVGASAGKPDAATMVSLIDKLAQRMQSDPDNLQGWMMLGRSALVLGQNQRAVDAYAQALRLAPKEPEIMLAYADALSQVTQSFVGKPLELINAALDIDPEQPQALWLAGLAEFQLGNRIKATEHWSRLKAKLPQDSKEAKTLQRLIGEAAQNQKTTVSQP